MKTITLFSSATALKGNTTAGYGVILKYGQSLKEQQLSRPHYSANQMELLAVVEALKLLKEPCEVTIITDAIYVVKGIETWLDKWRQRDFQKVLNLELWLDYVNAATSHTIEVKWVTDYVKNPEVARCNALALQAVEKNKK